jgi:hypothetical protein
MVALKNTNHRIRGSSFHSASNDPFDEAECKTRQANRRYPHEGCSYGSTNGAITVKTSSALFCVGEVHSENDPMNYLSECF